MEKVSYVYKDIEKNLSIKTAKIIILLGATVILPFGLYNFFLGRYKIGLICAITIAIAGVGLFFISKRKFVFVVGLILQSTLFFLHIGTMLMQKEFHSGTTYWIMTIPVTSIYLLGKKSAAVLNAFILVSTIVIFINIRSFASFDIPKVEIVRFVAAYYLIFIFLYYYKGVQENLIFKLHQTNKLIVDKTSKLNDCSDDLYVENNCLSKIMNDQLILNGNFIHDLKLIQGSLEKAGILVRETTSLSQEIKKKGEDGETELKNLSRSINNFNNIDEQLSNLIGAVNNILEKTQIINDIVHATKVLSFNAAIEAARAGKYGKGFNVVAQEIHRLASVSGTSADKAEELVSEGKKTIDNITRNINEVVLEVKKISEEVIDIFARILEKERQMEDKVSKMNLVYQTQGENTTNLLKIIDEVMLKNKIINQISETTIKRSQELKRLNDELVGTSRI